MKHSTKVSKVQDGHAKAQAKGAKRKAVVVKGLGLAVCNALEQQGETVRQAILPIIGQNQETVLQAMVEVTERRDLRIKECTGERKAKKIASVRVMYSRISVILKAIYNKLNLDKIKSSRSFAEMYAFASNKAKSSDGRTKPLSADQFKVWTGNVKRIIGDLGTKPTAAEKGKFSDQLAHLEQHLRDVLGTLAKYSSLTVIPVRDMLGLIAKRKVHIKLAKAA